MKERLKRLYILISSLNSEDQKEVIKIIEDIAQDRYKDGLYAANGPQINIYKDREDH